MKTPYTPRDHGAALAWLVCAGGVLVVAAGAEAARCAAGAGLLAAWWAWHGPRLALEAVAARRSPARRSGLADGTTTVTLSCAGEGLAALEAAGAVVVTRLKRRPWWRHHPLALASAALRPVGVRVPVPRTVRETRRVVKVSAGTATLTVEPSSGPWSREDRATMPIHVEVTGEHIARADAAPDGDDALVLAIEAHPDVEAASRAPGERQVVVLGRDGSWYTGEPPREAATEPFGFELELTKVSTSDPWADEG